MSAKIKGGYYIKARQIKDSWIAHAPPVMREVWDYLLREANHKDKKYDGFIVKRGQLFRTFREIREALHWKVGYRKKMYSENQMKHCMKVLRTHLMIELTSQPRGNLITICNYDFYQTPSNYESTGESTNESTNNQPTINRSSPSINKNEEKEKNEKNEKNEKKKQYEKVKSPLTKKLPTKDIYGTKTNKTKYNSTKDNIFSFWNSQNIIIHKVEPKCGQITLNKALKDLLKSYSENEIIQGIKNYSIIIKSEDYFFQYRWNLTEFLIRGFEKFKDFELAKNNYSYSNNGYSRNIHEKNKQAIEEWLNEQEGQQEI